MPERSSNLPPSSPPRPRGRAAVWARRGGAALLALVALLYLPEPTAEGSPPAAGRPFVWGQDDLWERLERDFDRARRRPEGAGPRLEAGLAGLDATVERVESAEALGPDAPIFDTLEGQLFEVAPLFGAAPARAPELLARVARLRRVVKDHSVAWDMDDRRARDTLYRLLYGSRAAAEELLLQMDERDAPGLLAGLDEPSAAPAVTLHGVTLRSGDILASRGGAPTSAFIARGNDYPGNFSHIALLHVSEDGTPTVIESHIESGVGLSSAEAYLQDVKLRVLVMRLRADHPALRADPSLPHRAASDALAAARRAHIPYDFAMDHSDPSAQFCSEVASAAYERHGVTLWRGLSSMSGRGLTRWLAAFGVRHFSTLAPSDLEYDPQVRVVAEWRDPAALSSDHVDNAVLDVMLERAEEGMDVGYDLASLPLARLAKGYSVGLELFGRVGPVPEGMSATTALRVRWLRERHGAIRAGLERRIEAYRRQHGRRPPYWTLVRLARQAQREVDAA